MNILAKHLSDNSISTNAFAKNLKLPQSVIWRAANGENLPSLKNAVTIADAIGITVEELYLGLNNDYLS